MYSKKMLNDFGRLCLLRFHDSLTDHSTFLRIPNTKLRVHTNYLTNEIVLTKTTTKNKQTKFVLTSDWLKMREIRNS